MPNTMVEVAERKMCVCMCERDRHLFCPGPKRLLALDGGGVRGAISVAFLEQIEEVLSRRLGQPVHLGHWFDLIGGTSTGAVIAGALAMGFTTADIKRFYFELAPKVFRRPFWRIVGLRAKFDAEALRREIKSIVGSETLGSEQLITGFCLISKRMDTGSPWVLSNNPRAPYWEPKPDSVNRIGNRDYPLTSLVRASTAAPFYFDPEEVQIIDGEKPGLFVDGGVSPHNNPSLMLFLMTIMNAYRLRWRADPSSLTIVSIGTGSHRDRLIPDQIGLGRTARLAILALKSLIGDAQRFALTQMQYLGQCLTPWWIDSELKDMRDENPDGKLFRFLRYDVVLESKWIDELRQRIGAEVFDNELGRRISEIDIIRFRSMDDPTIIKDIYKIARFAAQEQVKAEHWAGDLPAWCNGRPTAPVKYMQWDQRDPGSFGLWTILSEKISTFLSYIRSSLVRILYGRS